MAGMASLDHAPYHGTAPNYPIGSVDSALRLLLLLSERKRLRVAEVSREIRVARSTAHRLIKMLEYYGIVRQDPDSKAYMAGPVLLRMGLQVVRDLDIRGVALPLLEALVEETGETVNLMVLQGNEVLCLDSLESPRSLRVGSRTGRVMPAYASASGRALLAEMPAERLRELYPQARLPRLHPSTIASVRQLRDELEATRERGYALQRGEIEPDVSAISAAVRDPRGEANFAVTVAVPDSRLAEADVPRIGAATVRCAAQLSSVLPW